MIKFLETFRKLGLELVVPAVLKCEKVDDKENSVFKHQKTSEKSQKTSEIGRV